MDKTQAQQPIKIEVFEEEGEVIGLSVVQQEEKETESGVELKLKRTDSLTDVTVKCQFCDHVLSTFFGL